jgi:hypothetical protein
MVSFLAEFEASEKQKNGNARLLMKEYPEDSDINLVGKTKKFRAYVLRTTTEMEPQNIYTTRTFIES